MAEKNKIIRCGNCGAKFHIDSPKCPYCNAINETGAEKQYMHKLDELKEDLSELPEEVEDIYKKEWKKTTKKVLLIFGIIAVIFLLVAGILYSIHHWMENRYQPDIKAQLMWEREYYPKFDAWYAEGNYDAIVEVMETEYDNPGYSMWNWEHYKFLTEYQAHELVMSRVGTMTDKEKANKNTAQYMVGEVMRFLYFLREEDFSKEEWEMVQSWRQDYEKILYEDMKFTKEEAEELYNEINNGGYISYSACDKYTAKIWKRFIMESE